MKDEIKKEALALAAQAHSMVEKSYQDLRMIKGEEGRLEQKRFLLADLACHLLQDALSGEKVNTDSLQRHLYAILTISDCFLPEQELKEKTQSLLRLKEASPKDGLEIGR